MEKASSVKPVLMIHEVREEFFDLPLEQYVLTFDDGLYSQFHYFEEFAKIPTEKIYFISTNIICKGAQSHGFPHCADAHEKARMGNYEDYMTLSQIKYLMDQPNVRIGAHSHNHHRLFEAEHLLDRYKAIKEDTEMMLEWFESVLRYRPLAFCYPYNNDINLMYTAYLKTVGFKQFFGKERTAIESLLNVQN